MQLYNNNVCFKKDQTSTEDFIDILKCISGFQYVINVYEPKNNVDIITKVITEISTYILNLTKNVDKTEDYYTEFWVKNAVNPDINLHYDCDEYDRIVNENVNYRRPIKTGILYLSDCNNIPTTIIDGLDDTKKRRIVYSFPQKNNLFVFDGGKYLHGNSFFNQAINNYDRWALVLNIWKTKPPLLPIVFNNSTLKSQLFQGAKIDLLNKFENLSKTIQNEKDVLTITLKNDNTVSIKLPEEICITPEILTHYVNNNKQPLKELNRNLYKSISDLISTKNVSIFLIENQEDKEPEECIGKPQKVDIKINTDEQRFLQRMIIPQIFTPDICEWFITETEEYTKSKGWITDRHSSYPTTDIEVKSIPCLFNFMLMSVIAEIHKHINATYSISNTSINIADMFIVKYDLDNQRSLTSHADNCCITASILLTDKADFSGCYVEYEDGIRYDYINRGDMIIHTHNHRHFVNPITSGLRYVLVLFLDVYTK